MAFATIPICPGGISVSAGDSFWVLPRPLTIELRAGADDQVEVWIDGASVIRRDPAVGMGTVGRTPSLAAGPHEVVVAYAQRGGGLSLNVDWRSTEPRYGGLRGPRDLSCASRPSRHRPRIGGRLAPPVVRRHMGAFTDCRTPRCRLGPDRGRPTPVAGHPRPIPAASTGSTDWNRCLHGGSLLLVGNGPP